MKHQVKKWNFCTKRVPTAKILNTFFPSSFPPCPGTRSRLSCQGIKNILYYFCICGKSVFFFAISRNISVEDAVELTISYLRDDPEVAALVVQNQVLTLFLKKILKNACFVFREMRRPLIQRREAMLCKKSYFFHCIIDFLEKIMDIFVSRECLLKISRMSCCCTTTHCQKISNLYS